MKFFYQLLTQNTRYKISSISVKLFRRSIRTDCYCLLITPSFCGKKA